LACFIFVVVIELSELFVYFGDQTSQSFPASGTFPMSYLFTSDDQNPGASASVSVLRVNIQG